MTAGAVVVLLCALPMGAQPVGESKLADLPETFVVPDCEPMRDWTRFDCGDFPAQAAFARGGGTRESYTCEMGVYPGFHPDVRARLGHSTPTALHGITCVYYPRMPFGTVVPVFGGVYRMAGRSGVERAMPPGTRFIRVVAEGKLVQAVVAPDALAVPVGGQTDLGDQRFEVVEIVGGTDKGVAVPLVRMRLNFGTTLLKARRGTIEMKVGDLLGTPLGTFPLRRIVPPDPRAQIVGWVEFDLIHRDPKEGERVR